MEVNATKGWRFEIRYTKAKGFKYNAVRDRWERRFRVDGNKKTIKLTPPTVVYTCDREDIWRIEVGEQINGMTVVSIDRGACTVTLQPPDVEHVSFVEVHE